MKKKELKRQLKIQKNENEKLKALLREKMDAFDALAGEMMINNIRQSFKYLALETDYEEQKRKQPSLKIRKVIFDNNHRTILLFEDGTKSIVKCRDGEEAYFQKEIGVQLAYLKRLIGKREYFKLIRLANLDNRDAKPSSFVPDGYCHEVQYDEYGLPIPDYDPESEIMD